MRVQDTPVVPDPAAGRPRAPAPSVAEAFLEAACTSSEPLALTDASAPDSPVVWANPAFADAVGLPLDRVVGRAAGDVPGCVVVPPADPATAHRLLRAGTADGDHARAALTMLERVGTQLSGSLDVDEALRHVVAAAVPTLADWCTVDLLEGDDPLPGEDGARPSDAPDVVNAMERRRVRTAVAHRDPELQPLLWRIAELDALRPGVSRVTQTLVSPRSLLVEELTPQMVAERTAGDPETAEIFRRLDDRAGAVVPLVARDRVIGALTLSVGRRSGRRFGRRELAVAEILAARAALAVDNARLFAAETEERRRAAALAEAGVALGGSLRTEEVLDVLLRLVVPEVGDWSFVLLDPAVSPAAGARPAEAGTLRLAASRHRDASRESAMREHAERMQLHRGAPGPGTAWATGRTQLVRAVDERYFEAMFPQRPDLARAARAVGVRSSVHVPLVTGGQVVGTWSVLRHDGRPPFTEGEARFLTELGRRAAQALVNAQAFEAEHVVALALQRSLLPASLPSVPGLQVAGRYLPGAGSLVGGDWYDVVLLPDGRVGLSVGDVMGRGVGAAAVMGQLRAAVRSYAVEGLAPRDVLGRLAAFAQMLDGEHFATCLYALHDPASGATAVASAGHPPPVVVRAAGGGTHPVDVLPGVPVGVEDPQPAYADSWVRLGPGDCLLMFTDGLVEDRAMTFGDGLARLSEGLAAGRPVTAEAACAAALRVMGRDRPHDDDTAVLAVRITDPAPGQEPAPARSTRLRLSAQPRAASAARRHVVGALTRWGAEDAAETAALLVSELVSNAVRHGHGPIDVEISDGPDGFVVRIGDASPQTPPAPGDLGAADVDADDVLDLSESGRGLLLVEALADAWGWEPRPDSGKDVWFRLAHPASAH